MSRFAFYCGNDRAAIIELERAAAFVWGDVEKFAVGAFVLLVPRERREDEAHVSQHLVGAVAGYVHKTGSVVKSMGSTVENSRDCSNFLSTILEEACWPLPDEWTGCFAAVGFSPELKELVICNDVIGYVPLYYCTRTEGTWGGTSLIALGRALRCAVDITGVAQQLTSPFCNYGRRTILRGVSRLLPGEWRKVSLARSETEVRFDNSLCGDVLEENLDQIARKVWDCLRGEIELACRGFEHINVALSGGWDSRHILAGICGKQNIRGLTYGNQNLYETQIARRCAEAVNAGFECFAVEGKYFPPREAVEMMVKDTEAVLVMDWWPILEGVGYGRKRNEALLVGDMCEAIQGRYLAGLSSRRARKREYLLNLFGRRTPVERLTPVAFDRWKQDKQKELDLAVLRSIRNMAAPLKAQCDSEVVSKENRADLEVSFGRVLESRPAFVPVMDELWDWFHKVRFATASQCRLTESTFRTFCPAMAMRFLRLISTVHPQFRMNNRLLNAVARLPEFDFLSRIPTAQIPWVSGRSPLQLRLAIWGLRSMADQWLTRRSMKAKSSKYRRRVLKSFDLLGEYRREGVVDCVRGWFSGRWLTPDNYVEMARRRGTFLAWPYINMDINSGANLSMILDLCQVDTASDRRTDS